MPSKKGSRRGSSKNSVKGAESTFGTESQSATCPQCKKTVKTQVTFVPGLLTWILCIVTAPFCCLPFCFEYSKDAEHHCPSCDAVVGKAARCG